MFSVLRIYMTFVKFISTYFNIYCLLNNQNYFKISYPIICHCIKNAIDYFLIKLLLRELVKFILSSDHFWKITQDILHTKSCHIQIEKLSFISIFIFLFSFSRLISMARLTSITLNRRGKREHLCLVSNLRRKIINISQFGMMLPIHQS